MSETTGTIAPASPQSLEESLQQMNQRVIALEKDLKESKAKVEEAFTKLLAEPPQL